MTSVNLVQGVTCLLMTIMGICGNILIMWLFSYFANLKSKLTTIEVILSNLAGANLVVVLTIGIPYTFMGFGFQNLLNNADCKSLNYLYRVLRSMSISLTSLLSCFQLAAIKATNSKWANIKLKLQKYLLHIFVILLIISVAFNIDVPLFAYAKANFTDLDFTVNMGYCTFLYPDKISFEAVFYILFFVDLLFVFPMVVASINILITLYRHRQRVKSIRSSDRNQENSIEAQAAKTVVTLVSLYFTLFGIDNGFWIYQTVSKEDRQYMSDINHFFTIGYTAVFPVIIFALNKKAQNKLRCNEVLQGN